MYASGSVVWVTIERKKVTDFVTYLLEFRAWWTYRAYTRGIPPTRGDSKGFHWWSKIKYSVCVCVCASKMNRRTKKQSDPHSLTHTKHTHFPSGGKIGKGTSENNFTRAGMLKRAADFGFSIRQTISPRVRWLEWSQVRIPMRTKMTRSEKSV